MFHLGRCWWRWNPFSRIWTFCGFSCVLQEQNQLRLDAGSLWKVSQFDFIMWTECLDVMMRHWRRVLCYESTRQKCLQRFWTRPHILVKVKESRLNGHWLAGLIIFHLLEDHSWFRWRSHSFWGSVFQCWPFSGHISDYFRVFSFLVFSSWSVPKMSRRSF